MKLQLLFIVGIAISCFFLNTTASPDNHAVFVSISLPGHITPLLGQAEALIHRGWRCTIVSSDEAREFTESNIVGWPLSSEQRARISFVSMGDLEQVERQATGNNSIVFRRTDEVFLQASSTPDFQEGSFIIFDWLCQMWRPMFDRLVVLLRELQPSIVVADIMSHAALDAAHVLSLPLVLHNADALNVLSPDVLPPDDSLPGLFEPYSAHTLGLRGRAIYPLARLLARGLVPERMDAALQPLRASRGLPTRPLLRWASGHLVLHSLTLGLEHARALPPLLAMVGPCLPRHWPTLGRPDALPADLRHWLLAPTSTDITTPNTTDPCLVLVNMGTIARLNAQQTRAFFGSLLGLAEHPLPGCPAIRVLWKLRSEAQRHLRAILEEVQQQQQQQQQQQDVGHQLEVQALSDGWLLSKGSVHVRVATWIPSQLALFQLGALRLFVSHCGINSAHESLFFGIPLLCIPLFADQSDMAIRVVDSGAGLMVAKENITSHSLRWALGFIFGSAEGDESQPAFARFQANARRMASLMQQSGGSERAADLIEHVRAFGAASLQLPSTFEASWLTASSVDVGLVNALALLGLGWIWRQITGKL